ncbi:MAG TPA: serine--tRNA ligase [Bacilli bacterium]|nr:serine--tRNA ligase [Bacilli bacterium]
MLDIKKLSEEATREGLLKRMDDISSLDEIIKLNDERKNIRFKIDELNELKNKTSKIVASLKSKNEEISEYVNDMKVIGKKLSSLSNEVKAIEDMIFQKMAILPNIPDVDVVSGGKENNVVVSTYINQPKYNFVAKDHVHLATDLRLVDYKKGVQLAGQGNWIYTGIGAQLEFALINYFINEHIKNGWEFMLIPHMLKYDCGFTAGQFPKFQDEVYWIEGESKENKKFLLPTAETGLVNLHNGETLSEEELPKKYFSYTPCFRREAGSSREEERGTVRGHQFNKVELVQYTIEEDSNRAFEEMLENSERLVRQLGLHYQVSKLAAGDCSASMCRTYDIEIWIPSMGIYKEVSSVSNARDYQARRGNIRYKDSATGKAKFVHTLNGSGLATSRLFPALLEQYQQSNGSIIIPEILRPYLGNIEKIETKVLKK